ncbi:metabolite traffic protein EboE [Paraglaciecola sp.]|uniref:metabolite traffic protein EboE n=1 Tax=Paraglaciecola sp. TaxID=1920173 RepID=UPI003EF48F6E
MTYSLNSLAYCSNVHPGADLQSVIKNIQHHFVAVKNLRGLSDMASGLWLSEQVVKDLQQNTDKLNHFKQTLQTCGVRLTSLNGFPFGDFHQPVVKQNVYLPTWAQRARLEYTQSLASILAECLPEDESKGAISTLPLGYAIGWDVEQTKHSVKHLLELVTFLADIESQTNKQIVICIEMEPDCVLQHTHELVEFFTKELLPAAKRQNLASEKVLRYLGCCYDTCHQAVMGEDIEGSLNRITQAGIQIGKIQISNAVKANLCNDEQVEQLTQLFADKKFLHQTKVFIDGELVEELPDLECNALKRAKRVWGDTLGGSDELGGEYLVDGDNEKNIEATIHYHIPVNQGAGDLPFDFLSATQEGILYTLDFLQTHASLRPFLEIETYTWLNFLQQGQDKSKRLHLGFAAEFSWLEKALETRNLLK